MLPLSTSGLLRRWWVLVLVGAGACTRPGAPVAPTAAVAEPDQETWDADVVISEDGRPVLRLAAPYVARYESTDVPSMHFLSDTSATARIDTSTTARTDSSATGRIDRTSLPRVTVHLFDAGGNLSATATSHRLVYFDQDRRFEAEGQVVIETPAGTRLETEQAAWDEQSRRIRADGFVRLTTPTERIQGYRLVADERLENYRLAQITGQVEVQE